MAMSTKEFRRVSICEVVKEVWDILQAAHEEIHDVKPLGLKRLG